MKAFAVEKVNTNDNLADLCTKPLSREVCWRHMNNIGQMYIAEKNTNAKT